jgi:pimeloyl-ACP methyl ester carboxylesterase
MPIAKTDRIEICHEVRGRGTPLLLVMGLGSQLVRWTEKFLAELASRDFRLIVFDNRDVGLSTHFDQAGAPDLLEVMRARAEGRDPGLAYGLDDMADDCVRLLDALGIPRAHVLGVSMGGMIAQTVAIRHPERLGSLTSIMSSTGNPDLPPAKPEVMARLMLPPAKTREEAIEQAVETDRLIGSPVFPFEEDVYRERAGRAYDRCYDPAGVARQMAAIVAHGDRRARLAAVTTPTLVIHGRDDPLVPVEAGRDTAQSIPGAAWLELEGMAHDLPAPVHGRIADAVRRLVEESRR